MRRVILLFVLAGLTCSVVYATVIRDVAAQNVSPLPVPTAKALARLGTRTALSSSVTAIGDSVMLGAARELSKTIAGIDVDAAKSRQMRAAVRILNTRADARQLGDIVIMHIGNNGPIDAKLFDEMMLPLRTAKLVIVVNLKVSRWWEAGNNAVLAEGVKRYSNTTLLDWHSLIAANTDLLAKDGTHLGTKSAKLYASMLEGELSAWEVASTPEPLSTSRLPR